MISRYSVIGIGLLGAITATLWGHDCVERSRAAHSVTVPILATGSKETVQWVDRGLLRLAQYDATISESIDVREDAAKDGGVEQALPLFSQRDHLYKLLSNECGLTAEQLTLVRAIVESSPYLGEGNPAVTAHPMSRAECRARRGRTRVVNDDALICGAVNMVALYNPLVEEPEQARVCIDQFEFPNVPCEYPIAWVRANEAAQLCHIMGKRLCDAHEWEGACAGNVRSPRREYESWVERLLAEYEHNRSRELVYATQVRPDARLCATGSRKSPECIDASWEQCGTNSYPAGAFPLCVSPFGVYDLHGNLAEHMNLPLSESQLGARGGSGETEMKGSWFAFDLYHPHADDCRFRAPSWHATPVLSKTSHYNYHLGFRCCKDVN